MNFLSFYGVPLLKMFCIGFFGWIGIILCRIFCLSKIENFSILYANIDSEIIKDGNNLFSTAVGYVFLGALVLIFSNSFPIISWIIIAIMIIGCIPSIISLLFMLTNPFCLASSMMFLSGMLNALCPFFMTLFLLINHIL